MEGKINYKQYEKDGQKRMVTQIDVGRDGHMTIVQQPANKGDRESVEDMQASQSA